MYELEIVIPSVGLDRLHELRQTLRSLEAASGGKFNGLTTVIFNTSFNKELEKLEEDHKLRSVIFNGENKGFVYNLIKSLTHSNSKYVWVFGDDDIVDFPIYEQLLEAMSTNVSLIHLPHFTLNDSFTFEKVKTSVPGFTILDNPSSIIRKSGFISSNIYRRDVVESFMAHFKREERILNSYLPKFLTAYTVDKSPRFVRFENKIIGQRIPAEGAGSIFINKRQEYLQHFHKKLLIGYSVMKSSGIRSADYWITEHLEAIHVPVRLRVLNLLSKSDLFQDYFRFKEHLSWRALKTLLLCMLPVVLLKIIFRKDIEILERKFPSLFNE